LSFADAEERLELRVPSLRKSSSRSVPLA